MLLKGIFPHIDKVAVSFNGHPPLGVNATAARKFAPKRSFRRFNGHPPLGVNATGSSRPTNSLNPLGFNGHPPLGVNATGTR